MVEWIKASEKEPPVFEKVLVVIDGRIHYMALNWELKKMAEYWAKVELPEEKK